MVFAGYLKNVISQDLLPGVRENPKFRALGL